MADEGRTSDAGLLVTTAIEESWGSGERIVFAGEWCRLYDRRAVWERRVHEVVPNHWDDRSKLRADHDSLRELHERLLSSIAKAMGALHGLERPLRFWRMILDPWLLTYVAIVWDRWECIRVACELRAPLETIDLGGADGREPCAGYAEFTDWMQSDRWNFPLFLDIIEFEFADRCKVKRLPDGLTLSRELSAGRDAAFSFSRSVLRLVDRMLGLFSRDNQIVIVNPYLPSYSDSVRLSLGLRQTPRLYLSELDWPMPAEEMRVSGGSRTSREWLSIDFVPRNRFEEFVAKRVIRDLPRAHVEDFTAIRLKAERAGLRPRAILTAVAHWGNELFKVWSAQRVTEGTKLVTMEHGGCIPPAMSAMSFDEDVSDVRTTWAAPFHPKHRRLPANKLVGRKRVAPGAHLGIVGLEMPRYNFRAEAAPKAGQILSSLEMACTMYSSLRSEIQAATLVKPGPNLGWNTRQRFADRLGADKVSPSRDYLRFLSQSRIVVCTYPQTTFSESMASGLPSLLLYPPEFWETMPQFDPVLETLRTAGIVFHDPVAAAAHIDAIWADPAKWWNSERVMLAKQSFFRNLVDLDPDWLNAWTSFVTETVA